MPARPRIHRRLHPLPRPAAALAGVVVIALISACSATSAGPAPFSASPAPSVTGSVVAPIPSSAAPLTKAPRPPATATPPIKAAPSPAATAPPAAGALRTSYPGIKKLVIVHSRWNNTPAGRRAIATVAAYNSALFTATVARSVEPARRLSSPQCLECQADIKRIDGYIDAGQRVRAADGTPYLILAATIFVSSVNESGHATVVFTSSSPAVKLLASDGRVVAKQGSAYEEDYETVDTRTGAARVDQIQFP